MRRATWADGRIKEKGSSHLDELEDYCETRPTDPSPLLLYWDVPPADGDAFLFLLVMTYQNRSLPRIGNADCYGLILRPAHCEGDDGRARDHYRRVGMFKEIFHTSQRKGGTGFDEGAQEEAVTIC